MVLLVPRQLRMRGVTGNVPYYGGRMSPAQAYAASHPEQAAPAPPPSPPAASPAATSETDRRERLATLEALRESGVVTEEEYDRLRARLDP